MIVETTLNIYPIVKTVSVIALVAIIVFLFHNGFSLNLFSRHDNSVIDKFLSKYPDVMPEFMKKTIKEQNIENNQEIHAINKRFDKNDADIAELKEAMQKVIQVLEELQKRG